MIQEKLISSIIECGWYHGESFLDPALCQKLIENMEQLPLRDSKIGKGTKEQNIPTIRNDLLYWLDDTTNNLAQSEYLEKMKILMEVINKELYLGLKQFEGHFAQYKKNGFYKKHLDQLQGSHERLITVVTYLNSPAQGGQLRIYSRDNPAKVEIDIIPKTGSLVCFLSNQIYHEVLPTASERLSIAGWFRTTIL